MKTTIKGLHTDGWASNEVAGNEVGWIAVGIDWATLVGDDLLDPPEIPLEAHYRNVDNCLPHNIPFDAYGVRECFRTAALAPLDNAVKDYHAKGVRVIGILIGVPNYARIKDSICSADGELADGEKIWCAPSTSVADTQDTRGVLGTKWLKVVSRFLAHRYGSMVHGWVIGNEVNERRYFRTGCKDCDSTQKDRWIDMYASAFNSAYDGIKAGFEDETSGAPGSAAERFDGTGARIGPMPPALVSMGGYFAEPWDTRRFLGDRRSISIKKFLDGVDAKRGADLESGQPLRNWRVAIHAYPRNSYIPVISADDLTRSKPPTVGFEDGYADNSESTSFVRGNISPATIGALVGYLRARFPDRADVWRVYMTEGGMNTFKPDWTSAQYPQLAGADFNALQTAGICDSFKNYVGTPGVEAVLYHRMIDNRQEGLRLGLHTWEPVPQPPGQPPEPPYGFKGSWFTFALLNRYKPAPFYTDPWCGFENLPYVRVQRANSPTGHRVSSRILPPGAGHEFSWYLFRDERPKSRMLYECWIGTPDNGHTFASPHADCEKLARGNDVLNLGPLGFAYFPESAQPPDPWNWQFIYACRVGSDDVVTGSTNCENYGAENGTPLGWARLATPNVDNTRYTRLRRAGKPPSPGFMAQHWLTTVLPPPGFNDEGWDWWILREPADGAKLYYECQQSDHSFPSALVDCGGGGRKNLGPLGYIAQTQAATAIELFHCDYYGLDQMVSPDPNCEIWNKPGVSIGFTSPKP